MQTVNDPGGMQDDYGMYCESQARLGEPILSFADWLDAELGLTQASAVGHPRRDNSPAKAASTRPGAMATVAER